MSEQVIQGIVMFLVGSCCSYFLEKWTGVFSQNSAMKFALQALLRNRMIQTVNYYRERPEKLVSQWELESFDQMYDAGKALGVDGYFDELKRAMHEDLRHENH